MNHKAPTVMRVFTLDVGDCPTVVFAAKNFSQAYELRKEQWLRQELIGFRTAENQQLWDGKAALNVRLAHPAEVEKFEQALAAAVQNGDHDGEDEYFLTYLFPVSDQQKASQAPAADPRAAEGTPSA